MNNPIPTPSPADPALSPDLVLTLLACCLAEGSDAREAVLEVGEARVQEAWKAADPRGDTAGRLLAMLSVKGRMDRDDADMEQALELTSAGWTSEDPRAVNSPHLPPPKNIWEKTAVMSWYWRAPSKRKGKPGRKFLSTNQAWRAMKKAAGEDPNA